jgi:hypothetical protein
MQALLPFQRGFAVHLCLQNDLLDTRLAVILISFLLGHDVATIHREPRTSSYRQ